MIFQTQLLSTERSSSGQLTITASAVTKATETSVQGRRTRRQGVVETTERLGGLLDYERRWDA